MKYGESLFDVLYLTFAIISGLFILKRAEDKTERYMGAAVLLLGYGDAFHLIPRVLNYSADADMTAALGIGKLITSVTMTVFYVLLYYVWEGHYGEKGSGTTKTSETTKTAGTTKTSETTKTAGTTKTSETTSTTKILILCLAAIRVILCLFPQNGWLQNSTDMTWGIIRNVPFVIIGFVICRLYYVKRRSDRVFGQLWLYILLSFAFYIPVAVAAGVVPVLGMLMLPKTICYMLMIVSFLRSQNHIRK